MPTVLHIFTAPERGVPLVSRERVVVRGGLGIEGDRYFDVAAGRGKDRDITLIEIENIDAFNSKYGTRLSPDGPRRNIVTSGVRLNDLCGKKFRIGDVLIEGVELCEPCRLFKIRTDPRVMEFFAGKGGLRARVLTDGVLERGASIETVV